MASRVLAGLIAACLMLGLGGARAQQTQPASPFANWAAIFVSGDYKAHSGADSEVFDNGRRDMAKAFVNAGFTERNTLQYSARPYRYTNPKPLAFMPPLQLLDTFTALTVGAPDGCLAFFTSHGSPDGIVMATLIMPPRAMADVVSQVCGNKPTVVIVSACFSGVFVEPLSAPNRMIMTAARRDRSSFGCGESDVYTYFDGCVLEELPKAVNFEALGSAVQACVARREKAMNLSPASEPQVWIGEEMRAKMPGLSFRRPPAPG